MHAGLQEVEVSDKPELPRTRYIAGETIGIGQMMILGDDGRLHLASGDYWEHQIGIAPRDIEAEEVVSFTYRL